MALGLGIETSCDETSLSIVEDGNKLRSLKIFSQIEIHSAYRGVVPEVASRAHLEKINGIYADVLRESQVSPKDLDYVAVTNQPGLVGSLMMGAQLARCIHLVHKTPIITVNHLEAHLAVVGLEEQLPTFPFLGVLLSGGNSSIYLYKNFGELELIADTLDDSLGEAFDKVSSILGLPYPGGPYVEREANSYEKKEEPSFFPKLLKEDRAEQIRFSYSGLKTAVLVHLKHNPSPNIPKVCHDFQETAFELVVRNIHKSVTKTGLRSIVCAGGVLANTTLRNKLEQAARDFGWNLSYPKQKVLCTDNGAMVACLGYHLWKSGVCAGLDFKISPKRSFEETL